MRPLRYSINVTLDGCCDHRAVLADEELHRHAVENLVQADALLFGRVTYQMMEAGWRRTGARPDWMADWMEPFARTIDAAKKYVVSSTLDRVDWNAELVLGALGPAFASDQSDVMVSVHQFVDAFNKGDTETLAAACADQTSIIDEFPPHEWHGVGACSKWASDYDADAKKNGITDGIVTLSKPQHLDITADRAYVVGAANYSYKKNGKPVSETGSILTLALQKDSAGWRITGWAWAKN